MLLIGLSRLECQELRLSVYPTFEAASHSTIYLHYKFLLSGNKPNLQHSTVYTKLFGQRNRRNTHLPPILYTPYILYPQYMDFKTSSLKKPFSAPHDK
ncbi:hypothetical protein CIHG_03691 [Coccidioides immitis H538.4]|uniref:Uncharacterized protein n=1 Tax=Coccidioides immitis H538.4 TaxID=396776 RepID=A0A0J8RM22_COCIT|nr:hypothetical protein CIHG_03691 [Coccidioides immitis H538.4]